MGNTPSAPPPLVSINACGNEVLVPFGTSLHGARQGTVPRGPVYHAAQRTSRKEHGRGEADLDIRQYGEESESTDLGDIPELVRLSRKGNKAKEGRMADGRENMPGPYDIGPRPGSAPAGYVGMRGGQGVEDVGVDPRMHSHMHHDMTHPDLSYPVPPQYAPPESMHRYAPGTQAMHNANAYASHPPRPPPSTRLPPDVQAAIDAAVQKSAGLAGKSRSMPSRSKASPATFNASSEGIDTCVCTTNCKCRKGERATGWYEGNVNIGGEEVPVQGQLNTRWVLTEELGKDCGDHTACRKSVGSNSSSSDSEASRRKHARKGKKKSKQDKSKQHELETLKSEIDKMKRAASWEQRPRYLPPSFAGYRSELDPGGMGSFDTEVLRQMRMMEMNNDPYGLSRVGGMEALRGRQGIFDPITTRNGRAPRMPPKPDGMRTRFEDDEFIENFDMTIGKGRFRQQPRPKRQTGLDPRGGGIYELESGAETKLREATGKRGGSATSSPGGIYQKRTGRHRSRFGSDGSDCSLRPKRRPAANGLGEEEDDGAKMYNLSKRDPGDEDGGGFPRTARPRISPSDRRGGARDGRAADRQAHAETDDDEDY